MWVRQQALYGTQLINLGHFQVLDHEENPNNPDEELYWIFVKKDHRKKKRLVLGTYSADAVDIVLGQLAEAMQQGRPLYSMPTTSEMEEVVSAHDHYPSAEDEQDEDEAARSVTSS